MDLPTALRPPSAAFLKLLPREPKHIPRYSDVSPELPNKFFQHVSRSKSTSLKHDIISLEYPNFSLGNKVGPQVSPCATHHILGTNRHLPVLHKDLAEAALLVPRAFKHLPGAFKNLLGAPNYLTKPPWCFLEHASISVQHSSICPSHPNTTLSIALGNTNTSLGATKHIPRPF